MQKTYSVYTAAEFFEKDRRTLTRALRDVKPDVVVKRSFRFKASTILNALIAHELKLHGAAAPGKIVHEHARLTRARAEKVERENALAAGRIVDIEIVGQELEQENRIVTEHFLNLAGAQGYALTMAARTAPSDEAGMIIVSEKLRVAIHEALDQAAEPARLIETAQGRRHGRREKLEPEKEDAA
jgi:hypothetical protein